MARDPDRIPMVIDTLEDYWEEHPELRLSQIIGNIAKENGHGNDPFYMEDDELLHALEDKLASSE